jgi:uncharacterized membrane protein
MVASLSTTGQQARGGNGMVIEEQRSQDPRHTDLEQFIGGQVLAWVGAATVVAGLALLMALGISQGWIGETARALVAGCLSTGMLGAGVWLHARRGQVQAAGAIAATGVCGLFMSATVATAVYGLIPTGAGLVLAFATGALATVLALRWSSPLMGGLGIAGTVIAPVLVGAPATTTTIAFEAIAVASAVGVLHRARWDWLLLTVMALSAPQWLSWLFQARSVTAVIVVSCVFGVLYAAAALGFELREPSERLRIASMLVVTLNALMLGVAGWFRLKALGHGDVALLWLAALSSAHLVAGLAAQRSARITSDVGLVCLALAVLLADVAFALTVDGPARAAGFAVGGIAFALLARRHRHGHNSVLAQYGLGGHIAVSALQALHDVSAARGAGGSTAAAVGALVAVAVGCLLSGRLAEDGYEAWRIALDLTGLAALAGIAMMTLDGAALTVAWSVQAAALARIGRRRADPLAEGAALVYLIGAGAYALFDQLPPIGLISGADDLGAAAIAGGAVTAATAACALALRATDARRRTLALAASGSALYVLSILVVSLSPAAVDGGVIQQGQLQLSALWSVTGMVALVLGLRRGSRTMRMAAWGLLGLAAGKVFLYDLAALTSVYRVGSFLALGLVLLAAAFAYQRMRPELTA